MKKMFLCLCLVALVGLVTACGGGDTDTNNNGGQAQQLTPNVGAETPTTPGGGPIGSGPDAINWDEHVTFTWWMLPPPPNDFYNTMNNNAVIDYLEHRFNVTFAFEEAVVGTEGDALALMMGTGRYTDAIHLGV